MSCDGDIAKEEVSFVKELSSKDKEFAELNSESLINTWISAINESGALFLKRYLSELAETELTEEEQLQLIDYAMKTILADNVIEYSEVKFFKKIRVRLSVSDEAILKKFPDIEDFLLPDNNVTEDPTLEDVKFDSISFEITVSEAADEDKEKTE